MNDPADTLHTTTTVHLSWMDRLKLLLVGRVIVKTEIDTEHPVGRTQTRSYGWVPPVWITRKRGYGEVMAEGEGIDINDDSPAPLEAPAPR